MARALVLVGCLLLSLPAAGQTVIPPLGDGSRLPTVIRPNGDALVVTTPGEPPTVIRRNDGGAQVITRPGQPPVVCQSYPAATVCQ